MKTAEEIFTLIDNQSVNKETGISLIINYGLRHEQEAMEKLRKELCIPCSEEAVNTIRNITAMLDELLKNTVSI
jgi:hypothetical protein